MTDRIEQIIAKALLQPCDNHRDRAELARRLARQVMEAAPAGVTLKPLVWDVSGPNSKYPLYSCNRGSCGVFYTIRTYEAKMYGEFALYCNGTHMAACKSLDEAKAVAHADLERRLKSNTVASPSYEDGIKEGMRRALEAVRGCEIALPLAVGASDGWSMTLRQIEAAILSFLTKEEGQ